MTLQKLTALSAQTLSLLLERQRLQSIPSPGSAVSPASSSLHLPQITRNLKQFRTGILELEVREGKSEAVGVLRKQYERMRGMLGVDGQELESMAESLPPSVVENTSPMEAAASSTSTSTPPPRPTNGEPVYARYKDDPELGYEDPNALLQTQQLLMDEQDGHLDNLSRSINRQRDISLQINGELDVHSSLLQELDTDFDHTESRLSRARRGLDRVAHGAKANGSTVTIAALILLLLILIIVFKT